MKMDIRHIYQDFVLVLLFLNIHPGLSYIEDDYEDGASFGRCPWIRNKLKNGRVRYRYKGRVAKFLCDSGYDLAGKRSSTCVRGQWSNPVPVCVARGCSRVPMISNGHVTEMYRGALLVYDCNPGYTLDGVASIHCDGRRWSSSPPQCVVATENPETSCDFENPDLCGWSHDPNHDFDWKRNQFATPSGHAGTGPSFDHTFGENKGGYYLYIEASSPRKINDTARLFSPVYPPELSAGCFRFWYHMYGATTGGLRVYLKPESHVFDELLPKWENYGDKGNEWHRGSVQVPDLNENFQIVIEGIRGESYVGDSAIDDVYLTTQDCRSIGNDTGAAENTNAESCRGRCREGRDEESSSSCGCYDNCYLEHNCCSDYATFCFEGNETTVPNTDETSSEFVSKTSPVSSTDMVTSKATEESSAPPKLTTNSVTETSSTILVTLPFTGSSLSTTSAPSSEKPTNLASTSTSVSTSTFLPSTIAPPKSPSTTVTTAKPYATPRSSPKTTVSPTTSVVATKILPTTEKTTISSTISSTPSSTVGTITNSFVRRTNSIPITLPGFRRTSSSPITNSGVRSTSSSPITNSGVRRTSSSPITNSGVRRTISSTTTSPKTTVQTTVTSMPPTKTTERTTLETTERTTLETTQRTTLETTQRTTMKRTEATTTKTTLPTTYPTTYISTLVPTSMLITTSLQTTPTSSPLPSTTVIVQSTSSSPMPASTVTTEPSTRKTYNLRPRTQRTTTPLSSVTYANTITRSVTKSETYTTALPKITTVAPTTYLNNDIATFPAVKTSAANHPTRWHTVPVTPYYVVTGTRIQHSTTFPTTKAPEIISTSRQYVRQTTGQYTPQIFKLTSTQTQSPYLASSDSYDIGASKAETTASTSSMPLVISILVVVVLIVAAVAYYIRRKQGNKRQSKLSDDSEMRFLQENEYMEYSDSSALDRILIK